MTDRVTTALALCRLSYDEVDFAPLILCAQELERELAVAKARVAELERYLEPKPLKMAGEWLKV